MTDITVMSKSMTRCIIIGALIAIAACAGAQPAGDQTPGFEIDRRPVYMIRVWNGSYDKTNIRGLSRAYRGDDAGERIAEQLNVLYEEGWRRIMLAQPAGAPQQAAQWGTIEQWTERSVEWQSGMRRALAGWLGEHPDATLGVYLGLCKQDGAYPTEDELGRFLGPWLACAVTEFGFDASSRPEARDAFERAATWLGERSARAIMEAIPITGSREPDFEVLSRHPALALERFVTSREGQGVWRFNPEATEVWIGIGRAGPVTEADAMRMLDRGFVPLVYSTDPADRQRVLRLKRE